MEFLTFLDSYKTVIIFYSLVVIVIYLNRNKFQFEGKLLALYRTKVGLGLMDRIAKRYKEFIRLLGYCSLGIAYVGFFAVFFLLMKVAVDLVLQRPGAVGASPVVPGLPIAGTGIVFPLIIGWISLFVIIVVHEFSHGLVARSFNLKVLHSGIVFIGPILGAFVEPDEKELVRRPDIEQYSVFAAGPVSNIFLSIIAGAIMVFLLVPAFASLSEPAGVRIEIQEGYPAQAASIPQDSIVSSINGIPVQDFDSFINASATLQPNQDIIISAEDKDYKLTTAENPSDPQKGYMGVLLKENVREAKKGYGLLFFVLRWFRDLFYWIAFISINIGLINLFPIFITDGARMLKLTLEKLVADKKKAFAIWKNINMFSILILLLLIFLPFLRWISTLV